MKYRILISWIDLPAILIGIFTPETYWYCSEWLSEHTSSRVSPLLITEILVIISCCTASLARNWAGKEILNKPKAIIYVTSFTVMIILLINATQLTEAVSRESFQPSALIVATASGFGYMLASLIRTTKRGV